MAAFSEVSNPLLNSFIKIEDFKKLQIHVILDYMPFTKKIHETKTYNQIAQENITTSNSDDFIKNKINDNKNRFNFTKNAEDKTFLLDSHITKAELESLLPELNTFIEKDEAKKAAELKKINEMDKDTNGGTRITKRQKKTPLKRNKHYTAKNKT